MHTLVTFAPLGLRDAVRNVLVDVQMREQGIVLKQITNGPLLGLKVDAARYVVPDSIFEDDSTRSQRLKTRNAAKNRRLSRTRRAKEHRHARTKVDFESRLN